jgi:hypothetical protein
VLTGSVAFVVLGVAAKVGGGGGLVGRGHGEEGSGEEGSGEEGSGEEGSGGLQGVGVVRDDDDGADQGLTAGGSALARRWIWVELCCGG